MNRTQTIKFKLSTILLALNFVIVASVISFVSPQIVRAAPRGPVYFVAVENGSTLVVETLAVTETGDAVETARITIEGLNGEKIKSVDFDGFAGRDRLFGVGDKGGIFQIDRENGKAVLKGRIPQQLLGVPLDIDIEPLTGKIFIPNDRREMIEFDPKKPNSFDIGGLRYGPADANEGKPAKGVLAFDGQTPFLFDMLNGVLAQITDLRFLKLQTVAKVNLENSFPLGFAIDPLTGKGYLSLLPPGQAIPDLHEINLANGQTTKIGSLGKQVEGLAVDPQIPNDFHCVLTPPTATNRVGTEHVVTLTAFDGDKKLEFEGGQIFFVAQSIRGSNSRTVFEQRGNGSVSYRGDKPGEDIIEAEVQHVDGRTATCSARKKWVDAPFVSEVIKDGKTATVRGFFDADAENQLFVDGIERAIKRQSDAEIFSKKGGKGLDIGTKLEVIGDGNKSNEFVFEETIPDLECLLAPKMVTNLLGDTDQVVPLVFARGELVDDVSKLTDLSAKVITGPNAGTGLVSNSGAFTYQSQKAGIDLIEVTGKFEGKRFSCRAFKKWVVAQ